MCFCFKIQINFFPPKDFIHFGFNTFLFFTPFCVLSGNLRGGGAGVMLGVWEVCCAVAASTFVGLKFNRIGNKKGLMDECVWKIPWP